MCEPCNVLQPGPQLPIQIKSQISSSKSLFCFSLKAKYQRKLSYRSTLSENPADPAVANLVALHA